MATATATTLQEGTTAAKPDLSQPRPNPTDDSKAEQPPPSIAGTVLSSKGGDATKDPEAGKDIEAEKKGEPVTDVQKKIRRAERFGMPVQLSEEEKRNSRAERFGAATAVQSSSDALKKLEEQKRKARADRFGIVQSAPSSDEEAKKKARLDRFGVVHKADVHEEEKKKARALRFSQATAGSLSQVNGKGTDVETKKAIEGKNTGGGT